MSSIHIETAQNVVIHHEVASLGDRLVAWLIDGLVKFAWYVFWFMLLFILEPDEWDDIAVYIYITMVQLPMSFYHLASELLMDGRSVGKNVMKVKVARLDGGQPTLGQFLLRWLIRPLDSLYGLGLVVVLINGKGQRLGDLAGGTTVVSLKQRTRLSDTLLTEVRDTHVVRFPQAARLTDAQAALVKEVLGSTRVTNRHAMISEVAAKVRAAMSVTGDGMRDVEFLQAVLRDYVHITGRQGAGTGHFKGERATSPSPAGDAPR
ncbi:MAG: RDD family protein [Flavobacteriales bacterium]|nr:RDD family protein [Flavobacteriales bacterium]